MRTPVLAMLLGLSLVACAGQISGTGGDDDDVPETCGNGAVDPGEECDGTADCTASCTIDETVTPRLDATVDKLNLDTTLMKDSTVIATLTSAGGFAGTVNIAATVTDSADAPLPLITVAGPTSVTLTADQTMPANFVITVPSNATGTAINGAKFKLAITSDAGNHDLVTTMNISNFLIISYEPNIGATQNNHPVLSAKVPKNITVKRGATVGYRNDDNIQHITHGDGIFAHETIAANTGAAGATYMQETLAAAPGTSGNLGCHNHDDNSGYVTFTVE